MKKITLSAALIAAMSTLAIAGGDIAPVEPVVEPIVEESTGAFYLGLAYGWQTLESENTSFFADGSFATSDDVDYGSIMLQAGYKFNDYVAIEGRYWIGLDEDEIFNTQNANIELDSWGIYVKPMYPVTEEFTIYGLLGYADTSVDYTLNIGGGVYTPYNDAGNVDGFSWGIGADYAFGENWSVFLDYVVLYDDDNDYISVAGIDSNIDHSIDSVNFGVTYTF